MFAKVKTFKHKENEISYKDTSVVKQETNPRVFARDVGEKKAGILHETSSQAHEG